MNEEDEDWPDAFRDLGDNDGYVRIPLRHNSGFEAFDDLNDEELAEWVDLKIRMYELFKRVRDIPRRSKYIRDRNRWRYGSRHRWS